MEWKLHEQIQMTNIERNFTLQIIKLYICTVIKTLLTIFPTTPKSYATIFWGGTEDLIFVVQKMGARFKSLRPPKWLKWPCFSHFGGTKNCTSGARIKILKHFRNQNQPSKSDFWPFFFTFLPHFLMSMQSPSLKSTFCGSNFFPGFSDALSQSDPEYFVDRVLP